MRFLHSLILSTVSVSTFAQVKVGSLTSLLEYADKHAPVALQANLSPEMSKQDLNLQASGLYPKINVFGTGDYYPIIATQVIPAEVLGGKPGTYLKAQFGLPYVFAAGAELTMPVVNLEKWAQLSKSKSAYSQSKWNSKAALENFHIQLMQAYYQTLATKDVLSLNDENAETTAELARIMADRYQNGVVNPSDFNRTKNLDIDVKNAGYNYTKQLQQAYNNLGAMLNLKEDSLQLSESLTDFKWPILQQLGDVTARPGWKETDAKLKTADAVVRFSSKNTCFGSTTVPALHRLSVPVPLSLQIGA